jgi:HAMP domain-containing protein
LAWFGGARPRVLAGCPGDAHFYNALGTAVLLLAAACGAFAEVRHRGELEPLGRTIDRDTRGGGL